MRHTRRHTAVYIQLLKPINLLEETITQSLNSQGFLGHFFFGDMERLTHTDALVGGQRAGAHTALVTAAVSLSFQTYTWLAAYVQRADTFRAVGLVGAEGH